MPTTNEDSLKIANAQGFWGDDGSAPARLLKQQPDLDYLTMDYLAEVSLSIMASQREKHPDLGYSRDCVEAIRSLAPFWRKGKSTKVITNGGGLNPLGCAESCRKELLKEGCKGLKIGVVSGDDVLSFVFSCDPGSEEGELLANMETAEPFSLVQDRLATANVYLGMEGIVKALESGADIVLTGRVADPSLTSAACGFHFGWKDTSWDRIAGGLLAGHIIECGVQACGGISTDWLEVPEPENIGFPVVEMEEDGSFVVTKPEGTGGCVTTQTVKEQLLYEVVDPTRYLCPDAVLSLMGVEVTQEGRDRVRVTGARGAPPPDTYKVNATYKDGYRSQGTLVIFGQDALVKARRCGEVIFDRVRRAGFDLERTQIECLGSGASVPGLVRQPADLVETVLRVAAADSRREAVERFSRELAPMVTAGPPGVTGYSAGRPHVSSVYRYWPCLVRRNRVEVSVQVLEV